MRNLANPPDNTETIQTDLDVVLSLLPRSPRAGRAQPAPTDYRPNHLDRHSGTSFIGTLRLAEPLSPGASAPAQLRVHALPAQLAAVQQAGGWSVCEGDRLVGEVRCLQPAVPVAQASGLRVLVVGTSGAGKSTFARDLAARMQARHIELDALHWGPTWTPRPGFVDDVRDAAAGDHWVCDGNYSAARSALWPRATHVVWLNFPRRVVWWRVFWRTMARGVLRQPLWAGNRESLRMALLSKDSILWWSLTTFGKNRSQYEAMARDAQWRHLQWRELRHPREAESAMAQLISLHAALRTANANAAAQRLHSLARVCSALRALVQWRGEHDATHTLGP